MKLLLCILFGLSGGLVVGGGIVAFFTALGVMSNVLIRKKTGKHHKVAQFAVLIGALTGSIFYFSDIHLSLGRYVSMGVGLFAGIFIGVVASALAETLAVMSVMADRLNVIKWIYVGIFSLIFGKSFFSIVYWLTMGFAT